MKFSRIFLGTFLVILLASFFCVSQTFAQDSVERQRAQQLGQGGAQPQQLGQGAAQPQRLGEGGTVAGEIQRLQNPLGSNSIQEFFLKIMQILILFAVPLIVFYIIFAGFNYVTARGNTEQITQATTALTWALVGGVLILGAEIILKVIQGTVTALQ